MALYNTNIASAKGANERIAHGAREGAHQQWARAPHCLRRRSLLKHPDATVATYKRRQMKYLK
jgi:hypothetical protein